LSADRRVLVTGAGGFIGRQSIEPLLAAGFEVHAVLSSRGSAQADAGVQSASGAKRNVQFWRADLTDPAEVDALTEGVRASHLLHFAWIATPGVYWQSPENYRWLEASRHLVASFERSGGVRAVTAGSCAEYDWSQVEICHERTSPLATGAVTPYAECKLALQRELEEFGRERRLSTAWGRLFFQYGPGEHPERLVASVIIHLLLGRDAPCSEGRQIRSFLNVRDVGAAFAALLDSAVQGAVNIGSADPVSIVEVLSAIGRQIGRPELIKLGARAASPNEPRVLLPDTGRLRDEVHFAPAWTLERGLDDAIRWWRNTLTERAAARASA
jgi:nucleoside-diphosphate-sugar epimerase